MLKKKYGGMIPKKKSLLSKVLVRWDFIVIAYRYELLIHRWLFLQGHERAYFDSAEWAMKVRFPEF